MHLPIAYTLFISNSSSRSTISASEPAANIPFAGYRLRAFATFSVAGLMAFSSGHPWNLTIALIVSWRVLIIDADIQIISFFSFHTGRLPLLSVLMVIRPSGT